MIKICLLISMVAFSVFCHARTLTFSWEKPTTREDGSTLPESEIGSYKLYENDQFFLEVSDGSASQAQSQRALQNGITYCYKISAVDTDGLESELSDPSCIDTPNALPLAPGALRVIFQ